MAFTKTFTYKVPDDYLAQTDSLGKTAEWTYDGPRWLFVFVDKETNKWIPSQSCIGMNREPTSGDIEHANVRAGIDEIAVQIDMASPTDEEAIIGSILFPKDTGKASGYPQKDYKITGDDTVYYSRPEPISPDHAYAADEIEYDPAAGAWKSPLPWFKPWITMEQHKAARDTLVADAQANLDAEATENGGQGNLTDQQRAALQAFIAELNGLYTKFPAADGWGPHMIPFPDDPRTPWIDGYDYRVTDYEELIDAATGLTKSSDVPAADVVEDVQQQTLRDGTKAD